MNKKSIIYTLLIILVVGIYYYQREGSTTNLVKNIDVSSQPIYQSGEMETRVYSLSGNLSYKITATQVDHFEDTGNTLFQSPDIILYNNELQRTWDIQADHATLANNNLLYLNDNVILQNELADAQLRKILTDNALVDLTTQIVTSKDHVTLEGANFTSTGIGLKGNLQNRTADILENVKTYYNTQNNHTSSSIN